METATEAAQRAGDLIIRNLGGLSAKDIDLKQTSDFVTRVDRDSEKLIVETIREAFPSHHFLAEESGLTESGDYTWIIDPLDGTTNFIHGYPFFSVSIALQHKGEIILGLVFDPSRGEMFRAEKGSGAFLNDKRLGITPGKPLRDCLVVTGFPFRKKEFIDPYLELFRRVFDRVSDLRRDGSAAIDLAWVAAGRSDAFFEIGLSPWDIAAGSLLIREAGGIVTDFGGGNGYIETGNVVAGDRSVQEAILLDVKEVFRGILDR